MARMPATGPGPIAATKMIAKRISGKVRIATSTVLPGKASSRLPSRLLAARNAIGKASTAPMAVPITAMKTVSSIAREARSNTPQFGFTKPRRSGIALRSRPPSTRVQVGRFMVRIATTTIPTTSTAMPYITMVARRTGAGVGGIDIR